MEFDSEGTHPITSERKGAHAIAVETGPIRTPLFGRGPLPNEFKTVMINHQLQLNLTVMIRHLRMGPIIGTISTSSSIS